MGFSESDSTKCRRHPNEKQHPGVCSSCLREKLSRLNNTPSFSRYRTSLLSHSSSFTSTPPYSSSATSAAANHHLRNGSDVCVSVGTVFNNGLKKSRSVSCAPLSRPREGANNHIHKSSSNIIDEIFYGNDSNSNSKRMGMGEIEEKGEKRKKSGFLKRLIHSTNKKA